MLLRFSSPASHCFSFHNCCYFYSRLSSLLFVFCLWYVWLFCKKRYHLVVCAGVQWAAASLPQMEKRKGVFVTTCVFGAFPEVRMLECWILNRKDWLDFLVISYHIKGALPIWNTGLVLFVFFFPQLEMNEE